DQAALLDHALAGRLSSEVTTLLSPFDPVVWDRQRSRELFNFDYTIECYTPAAKRKFGYFTLPILHRGQLVGRIDPKAHRSRGVFEVKSIHLEENISPDDDLTVSLAAALNKLARWHDTPELILQPSGSVDFIKAVQLASNRP
ncbi:MAG: crosslink repair DNA glycosylase YcaQ family protein, partial [Anaerolineaceae bacterium]